MPSGTQHKWQFKIGDGASPEVFTRPTWLQEVPEFAPENYTIRNVTTQEDTATGNRQKFAFNRMREGAEFTLGGMFIPSDTQYQALKAAEGTDAGINVQYVIVGATTTVTYEFTILVINEVLSGGDTRDNTTEDRVSFQCKINSDVTRTTA